jgi:hypothetical protein
MRFVIYVHNHTDTPPERTRPASNTMLQRQQLPFPWLFRIDAYPASPAGVVNGRPHQVTV